MRVLKKIGLLCLLMLVAALNAFVYWNSHLYYKAMREEDRKARIDSLERSNKFAPLNDLVFFELGRAYFDLGIENLGDPGTAEKYFLKSVQNLERSVSINPASPYAHFYLGQSLLNLNFFSPGDEADFLGEFRRAARLAGEDSRIFLEVGKIFFSRWLRLGPEDREFTLWVLREILARRDEEKTTLFLHIWEMNVGDSSVMESVLPRDSRVYRQFAGYLGEKSLFLEDRQRLLAEAEKMEFERAGKEIELGEMALFNLRIQEARGHLERALGLLRRIRFYQTLRAQNLIFGGEFSETRKRVLLNLVKCGVEERAGLAGIEAWLREYLTLEDQPREVGNLEEYLRTRGILPEQFSQRFDDLGRLAVELLLQFKQNRYRDIIGVGRMLEGSFVVIPEAKKRDYVAILQLIGDSYQKVDYLYDAGDAYRKAQEIDPANLETLWRLRQNYDRLSDEAKIREVDRAMEKIVAPRNTEFGDRRIGKGEAFSRKLVFPGKRIVLELLLRTGGKSVSPLVAVFWNGRVVWEDYLQTGALTLELETKVGENALEVLPVNSPVFLRGISWRPGGEANKNFALLQIH